MIISEFRLYVNERIITQDYALNFKSAFLSCLRKFSQFNEEFFIK